MDTKNKNIVVGFPIWNYTLPYLENLSNRQKHECALSDSDCIIYDSVNDFFSELNNDFVDAENMYWFSIVI